jgi:hypothetical protein
MIDAIADTAFRASTAERRFVLPPASKGFRVDTAPECRSRAVEDDAAASATNLPSLRVRLQRSAAAWRLRADMLDRRQTG